MWKRLRRWLPRTLLPAGFILGALSTAIVLSTNTYQSPAFDVARAFGIAALITIFLGMYFLRSSGEEHPS